MTRRTQQVESMTAGTVLIYEVAYQGNESQTLCMDPSFRRRADAAAFAKKADGCGLRYGAFVKARRVTEEHAAKMLRLR